MANIIKTGPNNKKKSTSPKNKSPKKIILQVAAGLVIVAVAVLIWMLASGRMVVMMKQPHEKVQTTYAVVCGEKIVDQYNNASRFKQREGSEMPVQDIEALKKIRQDVSEKKGSASDPTCQTILFWTALAQNDFKSAQAAYKLVDEMHAQDRFANSDIVNDTQLSDYPSLLMTINPNSTETEEGKGQ